HFVYDAGQPKGNESGIRAPTNSISGTDIVMAFGIFVVVAIVLFFGILMALGMGNYFDTFG
ncbi:hypothetical protein MUP37_01570, partial [Candidatus Bathyarchaeota archaeon]|nr:hypothetical protein [Candidatus Bathyarchaeota archaeon]